ncbi:MAG: serine protease [Alphaproteobacteria bacterium]|nr:serine protease [Alphaproteobacteria bacterium]
MQTSSAISDVKGLSNLGLQMRDEMQGFYQRSGTNGFCKWAVRGLVAVSAAATVGLAFGSGLQAQTQSSPRSGIERQLQQQERLNEALQNRINQLEQRLQADECAILREQGGRACLVPRPLIEFNRPVAPSLPPRAMPSDETSPATAPGSLEPQTDGQLQTAQADGTPPNTGDATTADPSAPLGKREMLTSLETLSVLVLTPNSLGSGFFVGPGLVLTNKHVVGDETKILITSESLGRPFEAKVVKQSATPKEVGNADFALLQISGLTSNPVATIAAGTSKLAGVVAAGYPGLVISNDQALARLGSGDLSAAPDLVVSRGEISAIQQPGGIQVNSLETLVHTARIMAGNSGGPLVDDCGRVVGINTFITADSGQASSAGFALGSAAIRNFLQGVPGVRLAPASPCDP